MYNQSLFISFKYAGGDYFGWQLIGCHRTHGTFTNACPVMCFQYCTDTTQMENYDFSLRGIRLINAEKSQASHM